MLPRARLGMGSVVLPAIGLIVLMSVSAHQNGKPAARPGTQDPTATDKVQPESPAAAYAAFRKAQAALDWSREYSCYSPRQQAVFSHTVVVTALYLEFQTDLYLDVEAALQRHGLSDEDLAGFWPRGPHVIVGDDVPQGYYEKIQAEFDARLDRWQREVHPKIRDGAGLIAALQPLIREAARRSSPESTAALTVRRFEGYAYGRLRDVRVDGDQAVGEIRVKSRFGAFIDSDRFAGVATAVGSDDGSVAPAPAFQNVVLDDASGVYCWLSEVAGDIRALSRSMQRPRLVLVGLPTGDVAVAPIQLEMGDAHLTGEASSDENEGDLNVMEQGDKRDEGQEFDLSNNGTRTVTQAKVRFERIGGRWFINSIDYR